MIKGERPLVGGTISGLVVLVLYRQRLGTGGSSRGGEILIQGDKRREVAAELAAMGLKCRII